MGRIFFFIGEGLKALRRSAAPSLAAIVTVAVTVVLLGVLIPVLQTTQGKTNEIRDQVGLSVFLSDVDANGAPTDDPTGNPPPQEEIDSLQARLQSIPHVEKVEYIDKDEARAILADRLESQNREDLTAQLRGTGTRCRCRSASRRMTSPISAASARDHAAGPRRNPDAPQRVDQRCERLAGRRRQDQRCDHGGPGRPAGDVGAAVAPPCCSWATRSGSRSTPAAARWR